jgi:hypothetical protein
MLMLMSRLLNGALGGGGSVVVVRRHVLDLGGVVLLGLLVRLG